MPQLLREYPQVSTADDSRVGQKILVQEWHCRHVQHRACVRSRDVVPPLIHLDRVNLLVRQLHHVGHYCAP